MKDDWRLATIATTVFVGIAFTFLAILTSMNAHVQHVLIQDDVEPELPADFDGLTLKGDLMHGNVFEITLTVRGTIQPYYVIPTEGGGGLTLSAYQIGVWCTCDSPTMDRCVYTLKYLDGAEANYKIPVHAEGGVLTFEFSTRLLGPETTIVGIDGIINSVNSSDNLQDAPADQLPVHKVLEIPGGAAVFVVAAGACVLVAAFLGLRLVRKHSS